MSVLGVNHVQVNVPPDALDAARDFYVGFLGLREIARPAVFTSKGIWLNAGSFEIHIGTEVGAQPEKTRAHLAYEVSNLPGWRKRIGERGWTIVEQPKIDGFDRFHFRDPFENNIELITREI